jgi:hypothetical protein
MSNQQLDPLRHEKYYKGDIPTYLPIIPGEYERLLKFGWDKETGHPRPNVSKLQ